MLAYINLSLGKPLAVQGENGASAHSGGKTSPTDHLACVDSIQELWTRLLRGPIGFGGTVRRTVYLH